MLFINPEKRYLKCAQEICTALSCVAVLPLISFSIIRELFVKILNLFKVYFLSIFAIQMAWAD